MLRKPAAIALATTGLALTAAAAAISAGPTDIYNGGDLHEGVGQAYVRTLMHGTTYTASTFPLAIRIRPPDALWNGVQLQSGNFRFVQLLHLKSGSVPFHGRGFVTLETGTGRTASVAKVVAHLHATPNIDAGSITTTRVAGFAAKVFDATITGNDLSGLATCPGNHKCPAVVSLAPFLTNHHCGFCGDAKFDPHETQDVKVAFTGASFRIMVISVRGKTVVIYLESSLGGNAQVPGVAHFATFLPYAKKLLSALTFGR